MTKQFNQGYALLIGIGESAYKPLSLPITVKVGYGQNLFSRIIDKQEESQDKYQTQAINLLLKDNLLNMLTSSFVML